MESWTPEQVSDWLRAQGFPQYASPPLELDGELLDGGLLVASAETDVLHVYIRDAAHAAAVKAAVLARRRAVVLNVYDFSHVGAVSGLNALMKNVLHVGGAFHLGVEIYGREYSFGATDDDRSGLGWDPPRQNRAHTFREEIVLGPCVLEPPEVRRLLREELAPQWPGRNYHLITRNCCHFGEALVARVCPDSKVPRWVNRFARNAGKLGALPRTGGSLAREVVRGRRRRTKAAAPPAVAPVDRRAVAGLVAAVRLLNQGECSTDDFAHLVHQQQVCYAEGLVSEAAQDELDDLYARLAQVIELQRAGQLSAEELAVMVQADLAFNLGVTPEVLGDDAGLHGLRRATAAVESGEISAEQFVARVNELMLAPDAEAADIAHLLAPLLEARSSGEISAEEFVELAKKAEAHAAAAGTAVGVGGGVAGAGVEPPPAPPRRRSRFRMLHIRRR